MSDPKHNDRDAGTSREEENAAAPAESDAAEPLDAAPAEAEAPEPDMPEPETAEIVPIAVEADAVAEEEAIDPPGPELADVEAANAETADAGDAAAPADPVAVEGVETAAESAADAPAEAEDDPPAADADPEAETETAEAEVAELESAEAEVVDTPQAPEKKAPEKPKAPPIQNPQQARAVLESLLFTSIEPVTVQRLADMLAPLTPSEVRGLLVALQGEYDARGSGLQIVEIAGGYQLATRPACAEWVMQLHRIRKRPTLSPAALETLAIVAYKQPITRAEIEAIRGVDSSGVVRMLQDIEIVKLVGHKEVPGRPGLYGTGRQFLKAFGLNSLNDLPSITDLKHQQTEEE